jgi:two-component system, OmpR family, KDP operon response regulator KdpE
MSEPICTLLIEDEPQIPKVLRHPLAAAGFEVHVAESVEAGLAQIAALNPAIVLLDLALGAGDGKDVIKGAREWSDVPIIVLSAKFDEQEKIAALDCGADDFVNKPFSIGELLARMRTALRRQANRRGGQAKMRFGDITVDFARRRVRAKNTVLHLTRREYDVFRVLAQHAGQVVTHSQLLVSAWGQSDARDFQHVRVVVGQLRRKLQNHGADPALILTEQGVGYRMQSDGQDEVPESG